MMSRRNLIALILTLVSVVFLIPGLIFPILSIDIGAKIPLLGEISLHNVKQSIFETIQSLFRNDNAVVGFLILLFSIIVPFVKAMAMITAIFIKNERSRNTIRKILNLIGKWSMADVFIVAIFIAFLSTSSEDSISASIHHGFFYFLTYCILSIIAFQVFTLDGRELKN